MKYDDASWHYGGKFPDGLQQKQGAVHIAFYVAWALLNGLAGEFHTEEPEDLDLLKDREETPADWFMSVCDEKFTDEDLNEEGNLFTAEYYEYSEREPMPEVNYMHDFTEVFPDADNYSIEDSWANYDKLAPVLDRRLAEWRAARG